MRRPHFSQGLVFNGGDRERVARLPALRPSLPSWSLLKIFEVGRGNLFMRFHEKVFEGVDCDPREVGRGNLFMCFPEKGFEVVDCDPRARVILIMRYFGLSWGQFGVRGELPMRSRSAPQGFPAGDLEVDRRNLILGFHEKAFDVVGCDPRGRAILSMCYFLNFH